MLLFVCDAAAMDPAPREPVPIGVEEEDMFAPIPPMLPPIPPMALVDVEDGAGEIPPIAGVGSLFSSLGT